MMSHARLLVGFVTMFVPSASGCAGDGSTSVNANGMASSGGLARGQAAGETAPGAGGTTGGVTHDGTTGGASPGGTTGGASPGGTTGGTNERGGAGLADGEGGAAPQLEIGGESNIGGDIGIGTGGQASSSGATPMKGETRCGIAEEGESARLSCPDAHRIERVIFASYGSPTGDCGGFAEGACHADGSQAAIESICLGRAACTVPANNFLVSDPCSKTVKSLAVEVECVEGEPTVDPAPYKGVANSPANEIAQLGATWCYNWKTQPAPSDCADPLFVPMIWGGGNVAGRLSAIAAAGYHTVLGFNEPNKSDQSNMSVADAIAQWPELTSDPNIRVGSPAVSDDGRAWLEDFMAQVEAKGLRVDFIAMHWYGWNKGSCTAGNLRGAVNWASQWGLPVWITEFGCMGSSNTDEATLLRFFGDSISMLQNQPQVERYAWYPWNTYNHLYLPDDNKVRQRTALGDAFMNAAQYR